MGKSIFVIVFATLLAFFAISLFTLPITSSDLAADGTINFGFPLPFVFAGGNCVGACTPSINWASLLVDILAVVIVAFVINHLVNRGAE